MTAAKTTVPVLGVPVQSKSAERHGFAAVHRADAGRRPGGDLRHRRRGRQQRGAVRRGDPRATSTRRSPPRSRRSASARPPACSATPIRARPRVHDRRHRGRRPARPHARVGGLSARAAISCVLDPAQRRPRRAGRAASCTAPSPTARLLDAARARQRGASPSTGRTCSVRGAAARCATQARRICPPVAALATGQDRVAEKRLFERLRHPDHALARRSTRARTSRARVARIGLPGVLKTRRLGYDGKGQAVLRTRARRRSAPGRSSAGRRCSTRSACPSTARCRSSARAARGGEIAIYPLSGNVHGDGHPAPHARARTGRRAGSARRRATCTRVLDALPLHAASSPSSSSCARGELLANEMAPRVHNSGHWTIEGAVTSQFENHLRAILGLPLGRHRARGPQRHGQPDRRDAAARHAAGAARACTCTTTARQPRAGPQGRPSAPWWRRTAARRDARARRLLAGFGRRTLRIP